MESSTASTLKTELVEVPFARKRSNSGQVFVYGPMPSTDDVEKAFSLDEYLAMQSGGEEEFDYLDGLASDIFHNNRG